MSYFGEHARAYYKVDEAIEYIESIVRNIPNVKVVYLPPAQVEGIRKMFETFLPEPEPPKFKTADTRTWGLFTNSRHESYTYNFNDPEYLRKLEEYRTSKSKLQVSSKLVINTSVGQVEIRPNSKLKYTSFNE